MTQVKFCWLQSLHGIKENSAFSQKGSLLLYFLAHVLFNGLKHFLYGILLMNFLSSFLMTLSNCECYNISSTNTYLIH